MPIQLGATGITFHDNTVQTTAASAGGQVQTQLFTSPGTWTKPASCTQVKVTVVGGGGAGSEGVGRPTGGSGGTSSFGALVSASGGGGAGGPGSGPAGAMGTGTVSTGTALLSGNSKYGSSFINSPATNGILTGFAYQPGSASATSYSGSSRGSAGAGGTSPNLNTNLCGGFGGVAIAICPVSGPVAITVGSGGEPAFPGGTPQGGGTGGAVVVEFVG